MSNPQGSLIRTIIQTAVDDPAPPQAPAVSAEVPAPAVVGTLSKAAPGHAGHLKILVENAPIAMAMFDEQMRYLLANRKWIDDFKLQQVDIIGRSQYEIFPTLHPGWRHVYERALNGQVVRSDRDSVTRDGQKIVYRWEVRPWRHMDTTVGGVMVTCERLIASAPSEPAEPTKPATQARQDSLWESALPMVAMDSSGRILRASHGAAGFFAGLGASGAWFWQAYGEAEPGGPVCKHLRSALALALAKPQTQTLFTVKQSGMPAAKGVPENWQLSVVRGPEWSQEGGAVMAIGLLSLPVQAPTAVAGASPFAMAPEASPMTGRPVEPAEKSVTDAELQQMAEELANMKVSQKAAADSELNARQREARLRSVLDALPYGMLVLDERGTPIYQNNAVATMLGHGLAPKQSVEEWLAKCCRDEQHTDEVIRQWREGVWRKQSTRVLALSGTDGILREIEFTPVALAAGGFVVSMRDVSEARRSEEMLRGAEAKFRTLVHEAPMPLLMTDRAGAVFDANPRAEAILGYTRAELRRMPIEQWLSEETAKARAAALREMIRCGARSTSLPVELVSREESVIEAIMHLASVPDAGGAPQYTVHFLQKVEKIPAAPSVPAQTQAATAEVAPAAAPKSTIIWLLTTDVNGRIEAWTAAAESLFGYDSAGAVGRGLHQLFRPSDATGFYAHLAALLEKGETTTAEWMFLHKTQGRKMGHFILHSLKTGGLSVRIAIENEPKTDEGELGMEDLVSEAPNMSLLDEGAVPALQKEAVATPAPAPADPKREMVLLGETHHRVKNHLQIITSMLNLQISTTHNEEARDALRSSQNRVRSIAALHQHLYQLAAGDGGDFGTFASGLVGHLFECYDVEEGRVSVDLSLPSATVPEEWLMPLALSLNEMVSNALKHAFPEQRRGTIRVSLEWGDERGVLEVTDNGVGLPHDFDDTAVPGLGLKIMRVFAGQLGGEVLVQSTEGKGATFSLSFPLGAAEEKSAF